MLVGAGLPRTARQLDALECEQLGRDSAPLACSGARLVPPAEVALRMSFLLANKNTRSQEWVGVDPVLSTDRQIKVLLSAFVSYKGDGGVDAIQLGKAVVCWEWEGKLRL